MKKLSGTYPAKLPKKKFFLASFLLFAFAVLLSIITVADIVSIIRDLSVIHIDVQLISTKHIQMQSLFMLVPFSISLKEHYVDFTGADTQTSRERHNSAPYLRLKNTKRTSKCQSIGELGTLLWNIFFEKKSHNAEKN